MEREKERERGREIGMCMWRDDGCVCGEICMDVYVERDV